MDQDQAGSIPAVVVMTEPAEYAGPAELCAYCNEFAIARLPETVEVRGRPGMRWTPVCYLHSWPQNGIEARKL
jgi:hypothetical protein